MGRGSFVPRTAERLGFSLERVGEKHPDKERDTQRENRPSLYQGGGNAMERQQNFSNHKRKSIFKFFCTGHLLNLWICLPG